MAAWKQTNNDNLKTNNEQTMATWTTKCSNVKFKAEQQQKQMKSRTSKSTQATRQCKTKQTKHSETCRQTIPTQTNSKQQITSSCTNYDEHLRLHTKTNQEQIQWMKTKTKHSKHKTIIQTQFLAPCSKAALSAAISTVIMQQKQFPAPCSQAALAAANQQGNYATRHKHTQTHAHRSVFVNSRHDIIIQKRNVAM